MILTCPACTTRYMVDPLELGRDGRRVRCAKCGHSWMQTPPQDLPRAVVAEPEAPAAAPLRAESRPRPKKAAIGWLIFLAVVAGGSAALYHYRQQVVDYWPPAARLYTELGIKLRVLGEGLEIRNLHLSQSERDGAPLLVVTGEIANNTQAAKDVPALRGALLDAKAAELQHWTFAAGQARLLPGEVSAFQTEVANPKPDAANISITFTIDRDAKPAGDHDAKPAGPDSAGP